MKIFSKILSKKGGKAGAVLLLTNSWQMRLRILEDWLLRITLEPSDGLTINKTWMVCPKNPPGLSGRNRENLNCFKRPNNSFYCNKDKTTLIGGKFKVIIRNNPLALEISILDNNNQWKTVLSDRETGSWYWDKKHKTTSHYQLRKKGDRLYGLGEKSGPLERSLRRFRMSQIDALGYNAEKSDPLYKSVPWLMVRSINNPECDVGLLYDTLSPAVFDCGSEHSNYHFNYRYFKAETKGLDLYVLTRTQDQSLPAMLVKLTGMPPLPPRWSLGFQFSSMGLADHPKGERAFYDFLNHCKKFNIPISGLHFSSGYTLRQGKRYVFTWDHSRFPNPKSLLNKIKSIGIHTVANIKPALLKDHPLYKKAAAQNIFLKKSSGTFHSVLFWGGKGSLLDFTSKAAQKWWKKNIKEKLLNFGFDTVWNDNNEYDIEQDDIICNGDGNKINANEIVPAQALLMVKASSEEISKQKPNKRVYTITRSGSLGIQRWAESWSGDNKTSWHTLKWNIAMGLGMALSGLGRIGHDIGGFVGEKPDDELLLRWFQAMALHPRCLMNSWKSIHTNLQNKRFSNLNNQTNLPWMHPKIVNLVRKALNLRYELLPVLYAALWEYHHKGEPPIRPLFLDYPESKIYDQDDVFAITERIIVAPVVEKGHRKRSLYLPKCDEGWYDYYNMKFIAKQGYVELEAPLEKLPILIKGGTIIPRAKTPWSPSPHSAPIKEIVIYPALNKGKNLQNNLPIIFDDGESLEYQKGNFISLVPNLLWDNKSARLSFKSSGSGTLPKRRISISRPPKWNIKILSFKGFNLMNKTK